MYRQKLVSDIEEYIMDELKSSLYYNLLAAKAPTTLSKKTLMEFSNDEKSHAESFKQAYYYLTGKMYCPQVIENLAVPDFGEALEKRLKAETAAYKKYGIQYLNAPNKYLNNLFFLIKSVEAQHAMRIPILLEECKA